MLQIRQIALLGLKYCDFYRFCESVTLCITDFRYILFKQQCTVKPVLSGHSKIDKTKSLLTNGSLMKVKSIAECSPWSILQHF